MNVEQQLRELKCVILDWPSQVICSSDRDLRESGQRALGDLIALRQRCYQGVRQEFLNLDANDLCATHVLIYSTASVFQPRLLAGLRICWENRTRQHLIRLPFEERMAEIAPLFSEQVTAYRDRHTTLVNPNMWYVHPEYGFNKTRLPLSEIAIWMMAEEIRQAGHNSYCAVINEEFKTSRWFANFGDWDTSLEYTHPVLKKTHKLMLMNEIYDHVLTQGRGKYGFISASAERLQLIDALPGVHAPLRPAA